MSKATPRSVADAPIARPLSLREVAALFKRTPRSIRNWVDAGILTPLPIPRGPYFDREQIRAMCQQQNSPQRANTPNP